MEKQVIIVVFYLEESKEMIFTEDSVWQNPEP